MISIARPLAKYRIHGNNLSAFSMITPERMGGYADRFIQRLTHLQDMLQAKGLDREGFQIKDAYAYVREMDLLRQVAEGGRIRPDSLAGSIGSVWREERPVRAVLITSLYCALFALPNRWRSLWSSSASINPRSRKSGTC